MSSPEVSSNVALLTVCNLLPRGNAGKNVFHQTQPILIHLHLALQPLQSLSLNHPPKATRRRPNHIHHLTMSPPLLSTPHPPLSLYTRRCIVPPILLISLQPKPYVPQPLSPKPQPSYLISPVQPSPLTLPTPFPLFPEPQPSSNPLNHQSPNPNTTTLHRALLLGMM